MAPHHSQAASGTTEGPLVAGGNELLASFSLLLRAPQPPTASGAIASTRVLAALHGRKAKVMPKQSEHAWAWQLSSKPSAAARCWRTQVTRQGGVGAEHVLFGASALLDEALDPVQCVQALLPLILGNCQLRLVAMCCITWRCVLSGSREARLAIWRMSRNGSPLGRPHAAPTQPEPV